MRPLTDWTTRDELYFLQRIGMSGIGGPSRARKGRDDDDRLTKDLCRLQTTLLRNYLSAADLREEWGEIDKDSVISFAAKKLRQVEGSLN